MFRTKWTLITGRGWRVESSTCRLILVNWTKPDRLIFDCRQETTKPQKSWFFDIDSGRETILITFSSKSSQKTFSTLFSKKIKSTFNDQFVANKLMHIIKQKETRNKYKLHQRSQTYGRAALLSKNVRYGEFYGIVGILMLFWQKCS